MFWEMHKMDFVTPDTTAYLLLGLSVGLGSVALYVVSLIWRASNLRKERDTLSQIEHE
jgi:hypothetical protein